jgi:hypothetical protein
MVRDAAKRASRRLTLRVARASRAPSVPAIRPVALPQASPVQYLNATRRPKGRLVLARRAESLQDDAPLLL